MGGSNSTLYNNLRVFRALDPSSVADNTAQITEIIDMQNLKSCIFCIGIGSIADVDATFVVLVEDGEAANLSDNAAVADEFLDGTEVGAAPLFSDDDEVRKIGYHGPKRYVRLTLTPAANASAAFFSIVAVGEAYNSEDAANQTG